jgi:hypothetical protein
MNNLTTKYDSFLQLFEKRIKYKSYILKDPDNRGEIKYRLYEDGVMIFMGSYVNDKYRGQGVYGNMLKILFTKLPKGTIVYAPPTRDFLVPYFKKLGFIIIDEPIRYWGKPENAVNMMKII